MSDKAAENRGHRAALQRRRAADWLEAERAAAAAGADVVTPASAANKAAKRKEQRARQAEKKARLEAEEVAPETSSSSNSGLAAPAATALPASSSSSSSTTGNSGPAAALSSSSSSAPKPAVTCTSFSRHSAWPPDCDVWYDVRAFKDPKYSEVCSHDGRNCVIQKRFLDHDLLVKDLLQAVSTALNSGNTHLGFYCNAGRHRSVAATELVGGILTHHGYEVQKFHLELDACPHKRCQRDPCYSCRATPTRWNMQTALRAWEARWG